MSKELVKNVEDFSKYFYAVIDTGKFYLCLDINIVLLVSKYKIADTDFSAAKTLLENIDVSPEESCVICWTDYNRDFDPFSLWESAEDRFIFEVDMNHFEEMLRLITGSLHTRYSINDLSEIIDCFYDPPDHLNEFERSLVNLGVPEGLAVDLATLLPTSKVTLFEMGVPQQAVPLVLEMMEKAHKEKDEDNSYKGSHCDYWYKCVPHYIASAGFLLAGILFYYLYKNDILYWQLIEAGCFSFSTFFFVKGSHYIKSQLTLVGMTMLVILVAISLIKPFWALITFLIDKLLDLASVDLKSIVKSIGGR